MSRWFLHQIGLRKQGGMIKGNAQVNLYDERLGHVDASLQHVARLNRVCDIRHSYLKADRRTAARGFCSRPKSMAAPLSRS
jgi:hypothetical protein